MIHFDSFTNSTFFTNCCGVAICDDQANCPRCGKEILPLGYRGRWEVAMLDYFGAARLKKMRDSYSKKEI